jgi:serine protease Do
VIVETVHRESPAETIGMKAGDVITRIGDLPVTSQLDVERAMLGHKAGDSVALMVSRSGAVERIELPLAAARQLTMSIEDRCWLELGLRVETMSASKVQKLQARYRGGLLVKEIRGGGPASDQGIRSGDVLVGLHVWETVSVDNVTYVLDKARDDNLGPLKFYVLRGRETLFGHLTSDTIRR